MIHLFRGYKDKPFPQFQYLLEKHFNECKEFYVESFNIPTTLPEPHFNHRVDYYTILKHSIKTNGILYATKNVIPTANYIITVIDSFFAKDDIVIVPYSPDYFGLLLYEACKLKGIKFFFLDTLYLKDVYQLTSTPLRSYEITDFERAFHAAKLEKKHEEALLNFMSNKTFPFIEDCTVKEDTAWEHGEFDIMIPGEKPGNTILLHKPFITTEELCVYLANKFPNKIIYYKHPGEVEDCALPKLRNVVVDNGCNQTIIRHTQSVHTISSITGIEAEILDKEVTWYSNTFKQKLKLREYENKVRFFAAVDEFGFYGLEENLYNKIKSFL